MALDSLRRLCGDAVRDALYGLRRIVKAPGFAAVGIVSLAIGIGLSSLLFAQLNALFFRPLPGAADPTGLVSLQQPVPYPFFETYRDDADFVRGAAAFIGPMPFGVSPETGGLTERVFGHLVSPEYFSTLGVSPQHGRLFSPVTERRGSPDVVVVSDRFWRTRLDADPGRVGGSLEVNGRGVTIVGVGPADFLGVYPVNPADLFFPVTASPAIAPQLPVSALDDRTLDRFRVVLRLEPGMTRPAAEAALDVMTRNLRAEDHDPTLEREGRLTALLSAEGVQPVTDEQLSLTVGSNVVLLGMVLTLVCGNLATLLLARASERSREVAIRLSLGAGRLRLVRQLVTEAVVIALAGGALGIVVAVWLVRLTEALAPAGGLPVEMNMTVDPVVLAFTFVVSVLAGIGFGLVPALATTRAEIAGTLKGAGAVVLRKYRWFGLRNLLVVYQVAGALMLLLVTGWVVLGYQRSANVDPGFDTANLHLLTVDPPRDGLTPAMSARLLETLEERLPALPAVQGVTLAASPPFADLMAVPDYRVSVLAADGATTEQHTVLRRQVGAGYFATLGIPIVRGRELDPRDRPDRDVPGSREIPVVLNQAAAVQLFPDGAVLDGRIRAERAALLNIQLGFPGATAAPGAGGQVFRVVGIVQDVKSAFMNAEPIPTIFWPLSHESFAGSDLGTTIALRGAPGADPIAEVRRELERLYPDLTLFNVRTMDEHVNQFNTLLAWSSLLNGGIGVFALILAAIGLAGVTTHAVSRRRKEIGIRIALGARAGQILQLVLLESVVMIAIGGVLGFVGAAALARAFSAFTAELARILAMGIGDPTLLVGAPLLLAALAFVACYWPARRSTRIDPLLALRDE